MGAKAHGHSTTKFYYVWGDMKKRCSNPKHPAYKYYGAKGIQIDLKWNNFMNFYTDMHEGYTEGLTLDRIDNNKNYCKSNCRWVTMREQNINKSNNRRITFAGRTQTTREWSEEIGIKRYVLSDRLNKYGWSVEKALFMPVGKPGERPNTREHEKLLEKAIKDFTHRG